MHVLSAIDRPLSIPFLLLRKYKWVSHLLLHVLAPHKSLSSITRGNLRARKSLLKMYPLIYALLFSSLLSFPFSFPDFFSQGRKVSNIWVVTFPKAWEKFKWSKKTTHVMEELLAHFISGSKTSPSELASPETGSSNVSFISASKYSLWNIHLLEEMSIAQVVIFKDSVFQFLLSRILHYIVPEEHSMMYSLCFVNVTQELTQVITGQTVYFCHLSLILNPYWIEGLWRHLESNIEKPLKPS